MQQARFVDVHVSCRTGGIDPEKLRLLDACIIQAGVGNWFNPLLSEQIGDCLMTGRPYATYHIPDPDDGPMAAQVEAWASKPGVLDAVMISDIEHPQKGSPRIVNATQAREHIQAIDAVSGMPTLVYSRVELLQTIFGRYLPSWWIYRLWIAQYLYESQETQFSRFETFLARWAERLPPAVTYAKMFESQDARDLVAAWQFSDRGVAQEIIANEHTQDPVYQDGMLSCDLNVSTGERAAFLALLTGETPEPEPQPSGHGRLLALVQDQRVRTEPRVSVPEIARLSAGVLYEFTGELFATGRLDDMWVKLRLASGLEGWSAVQYQRTVYLRSV